MSITSYKIGDLVQGIITEVKSSHVQVILEDGAIGYIRARDLDLNKDTLPMHVVKVGEKVSARVTVVDNDHHRIELSRRATLEDPWPMFRYITNIGDVVQGVVKAIHPNRIYIRISDGIDGIVYLRDLVPWKLASASEVLMLGDQVEGIVVEFLTKKRQVRISIKHRILQHISAAGFIQVVNRTRNDASYDSSVEHYLSVAGALPHDMTTPYGQLRKILIVEDNVEIITLLGQLLRQRGFSVIEAKTLENARSVLDRELVEIILLDVNLRGESGLSLVGEIQKKGTHLSPYIVVMSDLDSLIEKAELIGRLNIFAIIRKPIKSMTDIEDILGAILEKRPISNSLILPSVSSLISDSHYKLKSPKQANVIGQTTPKMFESLLRSVSSKIGAQACILFEMNITGEITIAYHMSKIEINTTGLHELTHSPVEDIITENKVLFELAASDRHDHYAKLFSCIQFESCIGLPLFVSNTNQYALFFFHSQPKQFDKVDLEEAKLSTLYIGGLLEKQQVESFMQRFNPIFIRGELASSFGHEVANKLTGLELALHNAIAPNLDLEQYRERVKYAVRLLKDLTSTVDLFQELRYHEINSPDNVDLIDIQDVIENSIAIFRSELEKQQVTLVLHLEPSLPKLLGNRIAFQQILINLMLNATQLMTLKRIKYPASISLIELRSYLINNIIRLEITDTGPGIHKVFWEKIFSPGFSTRGGSGLGLFISRIFAQEYNAKVEVQESFMFIGTTFRLELEIYKASTEHQ